MLRKIGLFLLLSIVIILLTIITQIGGVILLLYILIYRFFITRRWRMKTWQHLFSFGIIYLFCSAVIIPKIAPKFGRVALPVFNHNQLKPLHWFTYTCNRHYVTPQLFETITKIAKLNGEIGNHQTPLYYLDANFPFFNGFPLLPHLSHSDGKKLDLAFYYQTKSGEITPETPSPIGYGVFVEPLKHEPHPNERCKPSLYWQYSILEQFVNQSHKNNYQLDVNRTQKLLRLCLQEPTIQKIFIEPHLKARLKLNHSKIRFQGCHSVRHDDHIHIQIH